MDYKNRDEFFKLARRLEREDATKYTTIIQRCRAGAYDDFVNEDFAAPKMQMIEDLELVGLADEAQRVKEGRYDQ